MATEIYYIAEAEVNSITNEVVIGYITSRTAKFFNQSDLSLLTVGRILTPTELDRLKEFTVVKLI
jgi:hypothetical protein